MAARQIEYVPLADIQPAVLNPKQHAAAVIGHSIEKRGIVEIMVRDDRTGRLVAGHGRLSAIQVARDAGHAPPDGVSVNRKGEWLVPVVVGWASADDTDAAETLVVLNQATTAASWEPGGLAEILAMLDTPPTMLGFGSNDIDSILASFVTLHGSDLGLGVESGESAFGVGSADGDAADDTVAALPERPVPFTMQGDVILLGRHRLVVGDCSDPAVVARSLDGRRADALVTDPPYGVDYADTVDFRRSLGLPQRPTEDSAVLNDDITGAMALWAAAFPVIAEHMSERSAFYCWSPPGDQQADLALALRSAGFGIHGSVVWVKSSFSFSRSDHKYQHEPCWYGWLANGVHDWHGSNNETSVWNFPKPHRSELHPTQKPLELIARCVGNITAPGDVVFDPFAGSGTTLIATHRFSDLTCVLVEKTPQYADVICARWQAWTGQMPIRNGAPVDFLTTLGT